MALKQPRRRMPTWARVAVSIVAVGLAVWFVLVPQFAEARTTLRTMEQISIPLLLLAGACELGSLLSYTALTSTVFGRTHPPIATLVLLLATAVAVWRLVFHTDRSVELILALVRHLRFISASGTEQFLRTMARQLRGLLLRRSRRVRALIFAAFNWILDAAFLWIMLSAFGRPPPIGGVITIYAVGCLVSMLPITPGRTRRGRGIHGSRSGRSRHESSDSAHCGAGLAPARVLAAASARRAVLGITVVAEENRPSAPV